MNTKEEGTALRAIIIDQDLAGKATADLEVREGEAEVSMADETIAERTEIATATEEVILVVEEVGEAIDLPGLVTAVEEGKEEGISFSFQHQ